MTTGFRVAAFFYRLRLYRDTSPSGECGIMANRWKPSRGAPSPTGFQKTLLQRQTRVVSFCSTIACLPDPGELSEWTARKQSKDEDGESRGLEGEIAEDIKTHNEKNPLPGSACVDSAGGVLEIATPAWRLGHAKQSSPIDSPATVHSAAFNRFENFIRPPATVRSSNVHDLDPDESQALRNCPKASSSLSTRFSREGRLHGNNELAQAGGDAAIGSICAAASPCHPFGIFDIAQDAPEGFHHLSCSRIWTRFRQTLARSLAVQVLRPSWKYGQIVVGMRKRRCSDLLAPNGYQKDIDGLVGKGDTLLAEREHEEPPRVLNEGFKASGRSDA
ncbi:hypothetical protein BKA70DRAFT_1437341 [Coprinopsis sp. MPI-PUGE-AT-0042]|nr:hypothetical protein BKA70DRAFT_1437341 [Coprinopsis sp. MPI-PUGE-AT-0042]